MILYYKNTPVKIKHFIPSTITKVHRRKKKVKKLTEANKGKKVKKFTKAKKGKKVKKLTEVNKGFLRALGFKV